MRYHSKEIQIGTISILIAIGVAAGTYFGTDPTDTFARPLLINTATTLFGVGIALFIVNSYLHRESRKTAVKSLLKLIGPAISDYHNTITAQGHDRFGSTYFGEMRGRYMKTNGDPKVFTPEERQKIYQMLNDNKDKLDRQLERLDGELKDLIFVLGWSFHPAILQACFECRSTISRLVNLEMDDSDESVLAACEHFLDADIHAFAVFNALTQLLGIPPEDVYESRQST